MLGSPTQEQPFFYNDLERRNKPVGSLDAKILKAPIRICTECNTTRTQPHDKAWERLSDRLRARRLRDGQWVRANSIFPHYTRREMTNVNLYFLKLFGCMICEAKSNRYDVPIDIAPFSRSIMSAGRRKMEVSLPLGFTMSGRSHPEVHLQFGKCDGSIGRSNLHRLIKSLLASSMRRRVGLSTEPTCGIPNLTPALSAFKSQISCIHVVALAACTTSFTGAMESKTPRASWARASFHGHGKRWTHPVSGSRASGYRIASLREKFAERSSHRHSGHASHGRPSKSPPPISHRKMIWESRTA